MVYESKLGNLDIFAVSNSIFLYVQIIIGSDITK